MFIVKLAGIPVGISPQYPSTQAFFADYLAECVPDFSITVSADDLIQERKVAAVQTPANQIPPSGYPKQYLEKHFLLRKIASRLPYYHAMLVHGSAVMVDGKAYLFTAPSGTGKSTHSRLWRELLGDRVKMINDDKPFVRLVDGQFMVFGTPWRGKHDLGKNISAPLAGICILSQSAENSIQRSSPEAALDTMLQQCFKPVEENAVVSSLALLEKLLYDVPVYHLCCNMDMAAAELSYRYIVK